MHHTDYNFSLKFIANSEECSAVADPLAAFEYIQVQLQGQKGYTGFTSKKLTYFFFFFELAHQKLGNSNDTQYN